MTWKGEKQRHSISRKGIKTKANGVHKKSVKDWKDFAIESEFLNFPYPIRKSVMHELYKLKKEQDVYTTSDLQGIVMAIAMKELNKDKIETTQGKNVLKVMELSDYMLEYIYGDNSW